MIYAPVQNSSRAQVFPISCRLLFFALYTFVKFIKTPHQLSMLDLFQYGIGVGHRSSIARDVWIILMKIVEILLKRISRTADHIKQKRCTWYPPREHVRLWTFRENDRARFSRDEKVTYPRVREKSFMALHDYGRRIFVSKNSISVQLCARMKCVEFFFSMSVLRVRIQKRKKLILKNFLTENKKYDRMSNSL